MYLYIIEESGTDNKKVGISLSPQRRLAGLQTGNPRKLNITHLWALKSSDPRFIELMLFQKFKVHRMTGEWFSLSSDWICDYLKSSVPAARPISVPNFD